MARPPGIDEGTVGALPDDDADPQRRDQIRFLDEDLGRVTHPVAVAVIQAVGRAAAAEAGVQFVRIVRAVVHAVRQAVAVVMLLVLTLLALADGLKTWHVFAVTGLSGMVNMIGGECDR
ncbi:MAG: hypothetical protein IH919_11795 [Deltaproteobacteria bacterium]|nr:hypothetical protein [Deltaproteobacteria bacterium]